MRPYTLVKLLVTILIGFTTGVLAVGLALGTEKIVNFKNDVARHIIHDGHQLGVFRAALFHIGFSIGLVLIGSSLVGLYFASSSEPFSFYFLPLLPPSAAFMLQRMLGNVIFSCYNHVHRTKQAACTVYLGSIIAYTSYYMVLCA